MDPTRPALIVNPRSGGGLGESAWAKLAGPIAQELGPFDVRFTESAGDGRRLGREEAVAGRRLIVAVGGDGTMHEVASGVLEAGAGATVELGLIPRGTGGDFRRTLELPSDLTAAARRIREAKARRIDAGRAIFTAHDGSQQIRHFVNVASFGFSSAVATRANESSKRFGAKAAYLGALARSLADYDNVEVAFEIDRGPVQRRTVRMAAMGNGRFFGGGMKICPDALLDDGQLDLVIVGDMKRLSVIANVPRLFAGTHVTLPDVQASRFQRLSVSPADPTEAIPLELDGETPGRLPATFEIVPAALSLRF